MLRGGVFRLALDVTSSLSLFVAAKMEPRGRGGGRRTFFCIKRCCVVAGSLCDL